MKKQVLAMMAAAVLVSAPAFAADNIVYDKSEAGMYRDSDDTVVVKHRGGLFGTGLFAGSMERVRTTITETSTENARSDTEYLADRPNPGRTTTTVRVHEEVNVR